MLPMGESRSQDIIDSLLGRGTAAPEAYGRQQWPAWMAMRPRPSAVRRDALLAALAARPLPPLVRPRARQAHWLDLLCGRSDGPPPPDQRPLRLLAGAVSLGLHLLGLLVLVWIALVRSSLPPPMTEEERVAVRLLQRAAGQGVEDGVEPVAATPVATPSRSAAAGPAIPAAAIARADPALPDTAVPDPVAPLPVLPETETAQALPAPALAMELPVQRVREPAMPELAVVEREIALAQAPPLPVVAEPRAVDIVLPEPPLPAVAEREVASAPPAAVALRLPAPVLAAPRLPEVPERDVAEREVAAAASPPPLVLPAVAGRPPAVQLREPSLAVAEREVALPVRAPAPVMAAVPLPRPRTQPGPAAAGAPAVVERTLGLAAAAAAQDAELAASPPAGAGGGPTAAAPAASRPGGAAAITSMPGPGPGSAEHAAAAVGTPAAAAGDDWSRAAAGRDDWSRRGGPRTVGGRPPVTNAPPAADQWTRQGLAASGTWLRQPPPGHRPGPFERYWVPHESLLAEWVRKGLTSIDIPLPGGSGRISCVISLLQAGGSCGVSDPDRAGQPAQARAAPAIPFKPELQADAAGSP